MGRPSLVLAAGRVDGAGFGPGEVITVLVGGATAELEADAEGRFSIPLAAGVDRQHGLVVQAFGSAGSRADTGIGVTRPRADE